MSALTPARYLYVDGHAYMLATHAAEQMERVIALTTAEATSDEVIDRMAARAAMYFRLTGGMEPA